MTLKVKRSTQLFLFARNTRALISRPVRTPTFAPTDRARNKGTKRISITLRERKETLPPYLMPIPECRCRVTAVLRARVLHSGEVQYYYECDRGQGQCGFLLFKNGPRT